MIPPKACTIKSYAGFEDKLVDHILKFREKVIFEGHEVGIAPLTSKITISESDEDMRNARMKPLSLNRVENLNYWILLQKITRANFHF